MLMPAATMAAAAASSQPPCASPSPAAAAAYACSPKDALIAWYKGEFAAANAIIDALCAHLAQIGGGGGGMSMSAQSTSGYEAVFAAIHRRRINWIPVLQWQTYYSVADVVEQLRRATGEQMLGKGKWSDARAMQAPTPTYQQQQQQQQPLWHVPKTIKQEVVTPMDVDRHEEKQEGEVEELRHDVVDSEVEIIVEPEIEERPTSTAATSSSSSSSVVAAAVDVDSNDDTKADRNQEDTEHPSNQTPEAADEREIYQEEVETNLEKVDDEQQQQPEVAAAEVEDAMAVVEEEEENKESTEEEYSDFSAAAAGSPSPTDTLQIPDRHPSPSSDGDGDGASAGSSAEPHEDEQQQHPTVVVEAAAEVANGIICAGRHDECDSRRDRINVCKGFVAKEHNKGHMVNIVKGLKVYEDAFTDSELAKLAECINQLRDAGQNGQLSGETYILFNQQLKGNKREIIQFGVPVFQPTTNTDDATSNIEPIPPLLQDVIDHLIQWRLIPASKKPNGCIINFYEQDEHSQPYYKPPHLDNPLSTFLLHETTMAFGKALTCDKDGNYKGSLKLQLREGSLVVMRGNSADMARHVICPTNNPRVSITFVKVRPTLPSNNATGQAVSSPTTTKPAAAMVPLLNSDMESGGVATAMGSPPPPHSLVPTWSMGMAVQATPILMLAPARPIPMNAIAKRTSRSTGTGVFLPWALGSKKYIKQLPPRIQKRRLPAMPQPLGMQLEKAAQIRCLAM